MANLKASIVWLALACGIGFLVPAIFSMGLRWERSLFLLPYIAIMGTFLAIYFMRQPLSLKRFIGPWPKGLIGVAIASAFLLYNVFGHPASAVPEGIELVFSLLWVGVAYGTIDGLLLNVLPVLIIQRAWQGSSPTKKDPPYQRPFILGFLALAASMLVTVAYHSGYAEFHGPSMLMVMVGITIITLTNLLTGSPLAAVVTHVIMHTAAVLHGMETTLQVPPHYALATFLSIG